MLNERSQTEKDKYGMIHFCAVLTWVRFLEMESRMGISRGLGTEEFLNGCRASVREDGNILDMDVGIVQPCECT